MKMFCILVRFLRREGGERGEVGGRGEDGDGCGGALKKKILRFTSFDSLIPGETGETVVLRQQGEHFSSLQLFCCCLSNDYLNCGSRPEQWIQENLTTVSTFSLGWGGNNGLDKASKVESCTRKADITS